MIDRSVRARGCRARRFAGSVDLAHDVHAVYWPAFLMSAGIDVPRRIFSHGFLFELFSDHRQRALRNYSHEAIVNRTNADLANDQKIQQTAAREGLTPHAARAAQWRQMSPDYQIRRVSWLL
jgi:hypothetical protein